jgi:hypothetical protein
LSRNRAFNDIEGINIVDCGAPVQATKISSDHVEIAIHQEDVRHGGAPKAVSRWHEVCCNCFLALYKALQQLQGDQEVLLTPFFSVSD